jgi:hypothetical protein
MIRVRLLESGQRLCRSLDPAQRQWRVDEIPVCRTRRSRHLDQTSEDLLRAFRLAHEQVLYPEVVQRPHVIRIELESSKQGLHGAPPIPLHDTVVARLYGMPLKFAQAVPMLKRLARRLDMQGLIGIILLRDRLAPR